jgi:putative phage-type endonuclease
MERKGFIGASDVPVILGLSPWKTPLALYAEKCGIIEPDETSEAMYWGTKKEQIIAERFSEDHKVKLIAWKKRYVHKEIPFFSCELDRIIVGEDKIVECKSVSEYMAKYWKGGENELPPYVIAQVNSQMGLSGRHEAWVACLIGSSQYVEKLVKFDAELYAITEQKVNEFWNCIQTQTPPPASAGDAETLLQINPKSDEQIQDVQEMETAIARRQELSGQIDNLKEEKELIEVKLKEIIGSNLGIKTQMYKVTWKVQPKSSVDTEALKRDGLYEKYLKQGETRVLRIALNKER